ncbi:MAG: hypothetical protein JNL90_12570 [Planctomycetes bacterium]|nr:hypothetical protein [Planctomycetota bacterium]
MNLTNRVTALLERRSALRLARAAAALLHLDARFRAAFPEERRSAGVARPLELESAVRGCLADPRLRSHLPARLASRLETLLSPAPRERVLPSVGSQATLARALLHAAAELAHDVDAPHLISGQLDWLRGDAAAAERGFAKAAEVATTPRGAAHALLHRAILSADDGRVDDALRLLARASALDPLQLAAHWTSAVYATAVRRPALADYHFRAALRVGAPRDLRARGLALERQLLALAHRGVGAPTQARQSAARLLTQTSVALTAGVVA